MSARRSSLENLRALAGGNILVLCYGNIYRSPFVEKRLARLLPANKFTVRSAGFYHRTGRSCEPDYISLVGELGVSLADHRSKMVSSADMGWADIIIIMDRKNWDALRETTRGVNHKIVWIGCCLKEGLPEVRDPYGLDADMTIKTIQRLDESSKGIARVLNNAVI